ncbi:hypothetical protein Tco_1577477 [Tanacetum coccineum]
MKSNVLTGIKEVDDLEQRIKNLEAIFSHLRDKNLKQKEVVVKLEDDKSSDDDTSKDSQDYLSSMQFPKQSHEEDPMPMDFPMQTEEEDPLSLENCLPNSRKLLQVFFLDDPSKKVDYDMGLRSLDPYRKSQAARAIEMAFGVCSGALGSLGALKPSTHPVIPIFMYPLGAAGCALEVDAMRALDLVETVGALDLLGAAALALVKAVRALDLVKAVRALDLLGAAGCALEVDAMRALDLVEAVGALDLVEVEVAGLSLNILISASLSRYLT